MSLIENMARRFPMPMDLIQEIERLKKQGDSNVAIGKKLDIATATLAVFSLSRTQERNGCSMPP
jgi:hypothetical protein